VGYSNDFALSLSIISFFGGGVSTVVGLYSRSFYGFLTSTGLGPTERSKLDEARLARA